MSFYEDEHAAHDLVCLNKLVQSRTSLHRDDFHLKVLQDPDSGRALSIDKPKQRGTKWPLDPPPVIELEVRDGDASRSFLHSPYWLCTTELIVIGDPPRAGARRGLQGCTVSSMHKIKLNDNKEHGLFIFGDLNVYNAGTHQLRFSLFEMRTSETPEGPVMYAEKLTDIMSREFEVQSSKSTVPQKQSTQLSKHLCEAGVKLRIRKDTGKSKRSAPQDWTANDFPFAMLPSNGRYTIGQPPMGSFSQNMIPFHRGVNVMGHPLDRSSLSYTVPGGGMGIRSYMDAHNNPYVHNPSSNNQHGQYAASGSQGTWYPLTQNHPEPEHDSTNQHGQYESTPNDLGQYAGVGSFGALTETPTTTMASVSNITAWDQPASTAGYSSGIATSGALAHSTLPNYDFNASTHPVQTSYYGLQNPFTDNQANGIPTSQALDDGLRLPPYQTANHDTDNETSHFNASMGRYQTTQGQPGSSNHTPRMSGSTDEGYRSEAHASGYAQERTPTRPSKMPRTSGDPWRTGNDNYNQHLP